MAFKVNIKRVYEEPAPSDGYRVLVDRIWPRGLSKEQAHLDEWMKEIAPGHELRKWFDHDPEKFHQFKKRYRSYLKENEEAKDSFDQLKERLKRGDVTLLYSAKDEKHNQAIVLKEIMKEK